MAPWFMDGGRCSSTLAVARGSWLVADVIGRSRDRDLPVPEARLRGADDRLRGERRFSTKARRPSYLSDIRTAKSTAQLPWRRSFHAVIRTVRGADAQRPRRFFSSASSSSTRLALASACARGCSASAACLASAAAGSRTRVAECAPLRRCGPSADSTCTPTRCPRGDRTLQRERSWPTTTTSTG